MNFTSSVIIIKWSLFFWQINLALNDTNSISTGFFLSSPSFGVILFPHDISPSQQSGCRVFWLPLVLRSCTEQAEASLNLQKCFLCRGKAVAAPDRASQSSCLRFSRMVFPPSSWLSLGLHFLCHSCADSSFFSVWMRSWVCKIRKVCIRTHSVLNWKPACVLNIPCYLICNFKLTLHQKILS